MALKFSLCNLSYSSETPGFNRHFSAVIAWASHSDISLFIHTVSRGYVWVFLVSEVCVCLGERETLNISEVCVSVLFSVTKGLAGGVQWHFIKSLAFALPACSAVPDYLLIPLSSVCGCVCVHGDGHVHESVCVCLLHPQSLMSVAVTVLPWKPRYSRLRVLLFKVKNEEG